MNKQDTYTRNYLTRVGLDPDRFPEEWARGHLPTQTASVAIARGYTSTVNAIQTYVYGDIGDIASGHLPAAATEDEVDGMLGSGTHRRMVAVEEFRSKPEPKGSEVVTGFVLMNGEALPVDGVDVVHEKYSFEDVYRKRLDDAREGKDVLRSKKTGRVVRGYSSWKEPVRQGDPSPPERASMLATVHWDCCPSARSCFRTLRKNGFSSAFGIDNPTPRGDVSVYQWLDIGRHWGYHAAGVNSATLAGFDLSNAVYLKHQDAYKDLVGKPRPVITARPAREAKAIPGDVPRANHRPSSGAQDALWPLPVAPLHVPKG